MTVRVGVIVSVFVILVLRGLPATAEPALQGDGARVFGYTHQRADGNRVIAGEGNLPAAQPVDVALDGRPQWVVAAPVEEDSIWAVVLDDGRVHAFRVTGSEVGAIPIVPDQLPPGMPPLLVVQAGVPALVTPPPGSDASTLTHPVPVDESGTLALVATTGEVLFWSEDGEIARSDVFVVPDARLLLDGEGQLLALAHPTSAYDHGVLGDKIEGDGLLWASLESPPQFSSTTFMGEPVVEGIAPIWADLTGDGIRDVIVTLSTSFDGAQIHVVDGTLSQSFNGPAIGQGYRWRHQIAVAPFGFGGELELVDVLTPHIGGVVEFYRVTPQGLQIVARVGGFSSHDIGSRNLDMAAAGDFDGDGQVELLLPSQDRSELGAVRRTDDGTDVVWTVPVGGQVTTNLGGVTLAGGRLLVGVGRADGTLRLWLPED